MTPPTYGSRCPHQIYKATPPTAAVTEHLFGTVYIKNAGSQLSKRDPHYVVETRSQHICHRTSFLLLYQRSLLIPGICFLSWGAGVILRLMCCCRLDAEQTLNLPHDVVTDRTAVRSACIYTPTCSVSSNGISNVL